LDQKAAKIIKENEIMTIIIGNELSNFKKMLNGKKFVGTVIC